MAKQPARVTLELPEEFLEMCEYDMVPARRVLTEFIADICSISTVRTDSETDSYICNPAEDRERAQAYYNSLHRWKAEWIRENLPNFVKSWQTR